MSGAGREVRWRMIGKLAARWIALMLAGWLACPLLRALWTMIGLGTPFYDWHWYLIVIAMVAIFPVWIIWRATNIRPISSRVNLLVRMTFAASILLAIVGYNGFGQATLLEPDRAAPIPISFWAGTDFRHAPTSLLEDLRSAGGRIYFGAAGYYPLDGERGRALADGLRRLAQFGIEAYLATPAGDDFLSVPVHEDWIASTREAADFIQREGLTNVRGVLGDAEPPFHESHKTGELSPSAFDQAVADLANLIADVHRDHPDLRIGVTGLWAHYVDRLDGDADLAIFMRSPIDPPGGWDFVNLMTYSSYLPPDQRAYAVYLFEHAMARLYPPERVSHLVGLIGAGMPSEPLLGFDDLVRDARLSRALGVREVVIFQLDGALRAHGSDFVRRLVAAVNGAQTDSAVAVPFSRPVSLAIYGSAAADALLDLRGPRVWLWIVWAVVSGIISMRVRHTS